MKPLVTDTAELTTGTIVAGDYRKAGILRKYGIDYCCGGKQTLSDACRKQHVAVENVVAELDELNSADILPSQNMFYWDADFLCDYIVRTHHQYVRSARGYLLEYSDRVTQNHQARHPELKEVKEVVKAMFEELDGHMRREEEEIFPLIKKMTAGYLHPMKSNLVAGSFQEMNAPVIELEHDHEEAGELMAKLRALTHSYTIPADACLTYTVFYNKLKEFEDDLMMHIHLENNILFPKSQEMIKRFAEPV